MAIVKGTNSTISDSPTPSTLHNPGLWDGRVRVQTDVYEASALAKGNVIQLAKIPNGGVVLPISNVTFDALGSNTAIAVGTGSTGAAASNSKYIASTATTSAGQLFFNLVDGANDEMSADTYIYATVSGSGAMTGTIRSTIFYSHG